MGDAYEAMQLGSQRPRPVTTARPALEVWEWKHAAIAWRAAWAERHPEPIRYENGHDGKVYEYGPHLAVVSQAGFAGLGAQVAHELDVDGVQTFDLPNGDRLAVIVAWRRQETQP